MYSVSNEKMRKKPLKRKIKCAKCIKPNERAIEGERECGDKQANRHFRNDNIGEVNYI